MTKISQGQHGDPKKIGEDYPKDPSAKLKGIIRLLAQVDNVILFFDRYTKNIYVKYIVV